MNESEPKLPRFQIDDAEVEAMLGKHEKDLQYTMRQLMLSAYRAEAAMAAIGQADIQMTCPEVDSVVTEVMLHCPGDSEDSTNMIKAIRVALFAAIRLTRGTIRGVQRQLDPSMPPDIKDDEDRLII